MNNRSWEHYAEDREHLLLALRRKGVRGWVPAQLVRDAILECGWRIERAYGLEPSLLGLCCPEERVVKIPVDFRRRLRVPETAAAVLNETLAHELGRIRLHAEQPVEGVKRGVEQKKEADDYARTFLVPLVVLVTRLPMDSLLRAETQQQRWTQVRRLAEEFGVTGWFMACALQMYGLIRLGRRREIEILPEAQIVVRRFAFARMA